MPKASEYRQFAKECRHLAPMLDEEDRREQLLKMAAIWEEMAEDRERTQEIGLEPRGAEGS